MIPGVLVALLTFPGVIVHELAHQMACRLLGLAVFDVRYFQFSDPIGYVVHEPPPSALKSIIISLGPLFMNSLLGAVIAGPAAISFIYFDGSGSGYDAFLMWLGVSISMHSIPSIQDTTNAWNSLSLSKTPFWLKVFCYPVCCLLFLASLGSAIWLDLLYGIGVCVGIPWLITR